MKNTIQHRARKPFVYIKPNNTIGVMIKVGKNSVNRISILSGDPMFWDQKNKWEDNPIKMNKKGTTSFHDVYEAEITNIRKRFRYVFKIETNTETFLFGEGGVVDSVEDAKDYCQGFTYNYWNEIDFLNVPKWYKETSWYQIFPDRFKKSGNDGEDFSKWDKLPIGHEYYGGNIKGIIEEIDHIKNLGFTGIYLTPIFEAETSHRYETKDYYKIDPLLGSEDDLRELIKKAHENGIRIMLDAVYNHIGFHSKQFQDVIKNKENSIYKDWFWINDFENLRQPDEYERDEFTRLNPYETFATVKQMPRLRWDNPKVKDYLINSAKKWTELGIDGWRLDVSYEPPAEFWREFNKEVKKINKDILIIGEVWWDSIEFLNNDIWHGIMNYPLRRIIMKYVMSKKDLNDKKMFVEKFNDLSFTYTPEQQWGMFNLISSHDVPRFISEVNNDEEKFKLAMKMMFMQPGAPSTYYGQEIGLEGKQDPDNRRTYPWDKGLNKFFVFFKELNGERLKFVNTSDIYDRYVGKLEGDKIVLENNANRITIDKDLSREER